MFNIIGLRPHTQSNSTRAALFKLVRATVLSMTLKVLPLLAVLFLVHIVAATAESTTQQILDARLALCATADLEYADLRVGKIAQDKEPLLLTLQSDLGVKAGSAAVRQAWTDYQGKKWSDADCHRLSHAPWAPAEGYLGHTLNVPKGAIGAVMKAQGWSEPSALPGAPVEQ